MLKKPFQDVVPPEKKSIRNIPIPNDGRKKAPIIISPEKEKDTIKINSEKINNGIYEYYDSEDKKKPELYDSNCGKSKRKRWLFVSIISVLVVVFIIGMMDIFASATISITPKSKYIDVDMALIASNAIEKGVVRYEIIRLSKSKTASMLATGEEQVELKASGKIVIYNNFSSVPQRLIIRTRFESPEGLVYRIPESVVVPGKSIKNGVETPGSVEVKIFADEGGEKYNIKKSDFTIPGFKNDANRHKNFYARSSTDIIGGFVGKMKTVSQSEKQTALQKIDLEAQIDLQKDLESKVPEGLTLLSGSLVYKSKELPPKEEASSVIIEKEVTAYAIVLNKQDLSNQIINEYISKLTDWFNIEPVIKDFSSLKIISKPDDLETSEKINLQTSGKISILADINTVPISQRLQGAPKKEAAKLIDEFAGISRVTSILRPIWKQSFPKDLSKIHVEINTK